MSTIDFNGATGINFNYSLPLAPTGTVLNHGEIYGVTGYSTSGFTDLYTGVSNLYRQLTLFENNGQSSVFLPDYTSDHITFTGATGICLVTARVNAGSVGTGVLELSIRANNGNKTFDNLVTRELMYGYNFGNPNNEFCRSNIHLSGFANLDPNDTLELWFRFYTQNAVDPDDPDNNGLSINALGLNCIKIA